MIFCRLAACRLITFTVCFDAVPQENYSFWGYIVVTCIIVQKNGESNKNACTDRRRIRGYRSTTRSSLEDCIGLKKPLWLSSSLSPLSVSAGVCSSSMKSFNKFNENVINTHIHLTRFLANVVCVWIRAIAANWTTRFNHRTASLMTQWENTLTRRYGFLFPVYFYNDLSSTWNTLEWIQKVMILNATWRRMESVMTIKARPQRQDDQFYYPRPEQTDNRDACLRSWMQKQSLHATTRRHANDGSHGDRGSHDNHKTKAILRFWFPFKHAQRC